MVFVPITEHKINNGHTSPYLTEAPSGRAEQKPNLKHSYTPEADFRKAKLSPNAAEGKNRPGLKDLARLVNEQVGNENVGNESTGNKKVSDIPDTTEKEKPAKKPNKHNKKGSKKGNKQGKNQRGKKTLKAINPHVKVEFQEKSATEVPTSKRPASAVSLSTPVNNPDNYDTKDVSADGFLAIKH